MTGYTWLDRLLDLDRAGIPPDAKVQFEFARLGQDTGTFVLCLVAFLGIVLVVRGYFKQRTIGAGSRTVLMALRSLAILLVLVLLFQPRLTVAEQRSQDAVTIVLIDRSLSMGIEDPVEVADAGELATLGIRRPPEVLPEQWQLSRRRVAQAVLTAGDGRFLKALARENALRVYAFDTDAEDITAAAGRAIPGLLPITEKQTPDAKTPAPGAVGSPVAAPAAALLTLEAAGEPRGVATDLGAALSRALSDAADQIVAGIVLITDGRVTQGEALDALAERIKNRAIPVHAIALGTDRRQKNLQVTAFFGPERLFLNDPAQFEARLLSDNYAGAVMLRFTERPFRVGATGAAAGPVRDLLLPKAPNDPTPAQYPRFPDDPKFPGNLAVPYRVARLPAAGERVFKLPYTPEKPGDFVLEFTVRRLDGESTTKDNTRQVHVRVLEQRARVLILSGAPSYLYRYVKNYLIREPSVDVSCWLQNASSNFTQQGNTPLTKAPYTKEDLFGYDTLLLIDPDFGVVGEKFVSLLDEFVSEGGGVCYVPGEAYATRYLDDPRFKTLTDILPVKPNVELYRATGRLGYRTKKLTFALTEPGRDHPVSRITYDRKRVADTWKRLPAVFWAYPIAKVKPGATVLVRHGHPTRTLDGKPEPLIVTQYYGTGRVLFVATDGMWRWRGVARPYFERFWLQTTRYLLEGRGAGGEKHVTLLVGQERYLLGQPVTVQARVLDDKYEPSTATEIPATIAPETGAERPLTLRPIAGRPGWFSGLVLPNDPGFVEVRVPNPGKPNAAPVRKAFQVVAPNREYDTPRRDLAGLRVLTTKTGGHCIPDPTARPRPIRASDDPGRRASAKLVTALSKGRWAEAIDVLPRVIPHRAVLRPIPGVPRPLWATPLVLILLTLLLALEWIWRKRVQLI